MQPTSKPRLKICCIADAEELWLAIRYGASAVGLVSAMPSGPGVITEERIAELSRIVPPPVASFLLTCRHDPASIIRQQQTTRVNTIQICDRLERGTYHDLHAALPGVSLVQAIHVSGEESIDEAARVAPHVDAILLDSGRPALAVKELGGTGRTHDWAVSARIRERVGVPIFLAGGLTADNVLEAIRQVRPFAIDVCSGVRTAGKLDEAKLQAFTAAIGAA